MRRPPSAVLVVAAALLLAGCTEVESESPTGYEPSKLEPVKGDGSLQRVMFTAEGADRIGLRTAAVRQRGKHVSVPYAALLYDPEGQTYVYTSPRSLEYIRQRVVVARVEGDRVRLSDGPAAGTEVVTVGAAEVYGTELEVPSH